MCIGEDLEIDLDQLRSRRRTDARGARLWFRHMGPYDAPPLPLSNVQFYELMQGGGIEKITCFYGRSLALSDYRYHYHPDFDAFACGIMASPSAPRCILEDLDLNLRFFPCNLEGLGPGLIWARPIHLPKGQKVARWPCSRSRVRRSDAYIAPN